MVKSFRLSIVNRYNSQKGVRYVNKRLLYLTKVLLTVYRWRSLPRVHRHNRASSSTSPQGSFSNGVCLFGCHHGWIRSGSVKVAVNTIVPRSPFFLFLYLKTQTVTHIRKNAVEYLRQWNSAICVIYNLCQRQKIR